MAKPENFPERLLHWTRSILFDPDYYWYLACIVVVGDALLTQLIIRFVPYTEIDWETYMYHIELFINGERDYTKIIGATGPLVYPAGHVYIHRALYSLTNSGLNIIGAQRIYSILYTFSLFMNCLIYRTAGAVPNWVLLILPLSRRLHSLYVLRLFNDCWAIALMQCSIVAFAWTQDTLGSVIFSLALSVKMSILLYLPGILLIQWKRGGLLTTLRCSFLILLVQLMLGFPFISRHPWEYLTRSFEFSREFLYKWTVNWRFIDESTFLSSPWAAALLVAHLSTLLAFAAFRWSQRDGGFVSLVKRGLLRPNEGAAIAPISSDQTITILVTCNLIGMIFARSLHYQFYSWYAQQIPFLTWRTKLPVVMRLALIFSIEYCWNVVPYSTAFSSFLLLSSNATILAGIWYGWPEGRVK